VGFAAGGAADTAARIIGKKLGDNLGVAVVIDNRPGAGGNIAHQYTAQGPSDGSVILLGSVGPLCIAPHLMKLPYDPVKDLSPITMGVNFPNLLVVHAGLKIHTFAEFVAYAKAHPGKLAARRRCRICWPVAWPPITRRWRPRNHTSKAANSFPWQAQAPNACPVIRKCPPLPSPGIRVTAPPTGMPLSRPPKCLQPFWTAGTRNW